MEKPHVAICYDFDKTLSKNNMQDYSMFPSMKIDADEFWTKCNDFTKKNASDSNLTYLYLILQTCKEIGIKPTKEYFRSCGKNVEFFNGLPTWFENINKFAENIGIVLEHYIISSGVQEIIEGTSIAKYFKKIYACSYCYNEQNEAIWPALNINYTNKTQFLFRINKGIFDPNDNTVNDYMSHEKRYVPFENMIYIGDSETDIPSMKLIRSKNGYAISVYDCDITTQYYKDLIANNRVDYIAKADYSAGSELETIVKELIETIYHKSKLRQINYIQKQSK